MRHRLTSERLIPGVLTDPFNAPVTTVDYDLDGPALLLAGPE